MCPHDATIKKSVSSLYNHIELINRKLHDKYGEICDERSRRHFELLLKDIDYEIAEAERRDR